jgi:hypothetical protein
MERLQHLLAVPAPGFTLTNQPGGFWTHRVEDIYAKFKRPFYMDH